MCTHIRCRCATLLRVEIHFGEIAAGSRKSLTLIKQKLRFFWEKRTLTGKFSQMLSKAPHADTETLFCANFVKFGRPEVGEVARCLMDKKKQNFGSRCRFCADRAQNLPGTAPNSILGVSQISSKSVHFRRSYNRTRERATNCFHYFA